MKVFKSNISVLSGLEEHALQLLYIELEVQRLQLEFYCVRHIYEKLKIDEKIKDLTALRSRIEREAISRSHLQVVFKQT